MCSPGTESSARSLDELEREICELAGHIAAATCRWLLLVAEFDQRGGWAEWGVKSCAHWLSWRCSIGLGAAREQVRVGRRLQELPLVREAFGAGELSYCKVRAITRVARPEIEESLVEIARHATGAQLEKLVRGYHGALAATLEQAERTFDSRYLSWSWEDDGSLQLEGRLPADDGALLLAALKRAEEPPPDPAEASAETSSFEAVSARRADALVSLARSALAERPGGDPCELVVHVDAETLGGQGAQSCGELANGHPLPAETVRRLGCDAAVVPIIERDGRPLSVGRRTRTIPSALRRALRSRDDGCRFPGCTHRRFLHAHHIRHWARGGPTSLENLVQLCSYHHRLVHEGGYCVERAGPRSVRFRRPDGRPIPAVPRPFAAVGEPLEHQRHARALGISADTCRARSAGDRLDYGIAVEALLNRVLPPP
jgi:Domain of unknown function (DUF222)/HNH endonuclease